VGRLYYRPRYGGLGRYIASARRIRGWTRGHEMIALARASYQLPSDAVIVEIGSFLGRSAVLLAGTRQLCGSGRVHCIDPFDASGDAFSVPVYRAIVGAQQESQRHRFDQNIHHAGLTPWVQVHQGTAETIGASWTEPIDMLFLDGDQSPQGARAAYEQWSPWLRVGGLLAVHNSSKRIYAEGHDGHRRLVVETVRPPQYADIVCVGTTTFARKMMETPQV
jgi:predicted O-methyltransferase YrrM